MSKLIKLCVKRGNDNIKM